MSCTNFLELVEQPTTHTHTHTKQPITDVFMFYQLSFKFTRICQMPHTSCCAKYAHFIVTYHACMSGIIWRIQTMVLSHLIPRDSDWTPPYPWKISDTPATWWSNCYACRLVQWYTPTYTGTIAWVWVGHHPLYDLHRICRKWSKDWLTSPTYNFNWWWRWNLNDNRGRWHWWEEEE